jgi:hypothetical protein
MGAGDVDLVSMCLVSHELPAAVSRSVRICCAFFIFLMPPNELAWLFPAMNSDFECKCTLPDKYSLRPGVCFPQGGR